MLDKLLSIDPNLILIGLVVIFFSLEMAMKGPSNFKGKFSHLIHSFLFQVIGILMGSLIGLMFVGTFDFISLHNIGLFNWISIPYGLKIILGLFLIDFADYWFHRFDHQIPL